MSDLIKRLKGLYSCGPAGVYEDRDFGTYTPAICIEAADEIERLTFENMRLVQEVADMKKPYFQVIAEKMILLHDPNVVTGFYRMNLFDGSWADWMPIDNVTPPMN
jgi:3-phosphoglycerate kinase